MKFLNHTFTLMLFLFMALLAWQVSAAEIRVAVASNFLLPLKYISRMYQRETGDKVVISAGSTGKLYAQIVNGAPYDVFLAANSREPERLEHEGYAQADSRFTYARGKLALWDAKGLHQQKSLEEVLKAKDYKFLSIANPLTAPYGTAALSVLKSLGLENVSGIKILHAENVSQAYQYVESGAADLGFVALSQLKAGDSKPQGTFWVANENMHAPIVQQAVLLKSALNKAQAQSFLNYLKSSRVKAVIVNFGYSID